MTTASVALWIAAFAAVGAEPVAEPQPFALAGGETIVFFGDSITQGGAYVEYVEAALRTRMPDKNFRIVNSGISSETISGTSETDHNPRRPYAHNRFDRDVAAHSPNVLVACFGMNDGNYHPFESERFKKYQAGVRLLIERAGQAGAKVHFMTPPPFDPYKRGSSDPKATEYGYKFPAVEYDVTLETYSQWLVRLRDEGFTVADVHSVSNAHLAARRKNLVSFFLAGDAVHPNATGHWLMAQTLLEAWNFPATWAEIDIDLGKEPAGDTPAAAVEKNSGIVKFQATLPLPVPTDPQWDAESLALERFTERFNRGRLKVVGLPAERYEIAIDGKLVGTATREELAAGLDLNAFSEWAIFQQGRDLLKQVQERRKAIYQGWRKAIADPNVKESGSHVKTLEASMATQDEALKTLAQPKAYEFTLSPARGK
ncbi:MAG TPA: SGNH/GDSL hydrolase family protein [Pirellulales bacterium]